MNYHYDKRGRISYHIVISDCGFWNLDFKHYFKSEIRIPISEIPLKKGGKGVVVTGRSTVPGLQINGEFDKSEIRILKSKIVNLFRGDYYA